MKKVKNHRIKLFRLLSDKMWAVAPILYLEYLGGWDLFLELGAGPKGVIFTVYEECRTLDRRPFSIGQAGVGFPIGDGGP